MKNSYLYRLTLLFVLFSVLAAFAQAPDPAGWWKFDDPADPLKPEAGFGLPLELVGTHQTVDGPAAGNGAVKIGIGSHYRLTHGIASNGGGSFVNEFTLMFDFRVEQLNKWYTFFQTAAENNNDGDCFIDKVGNIGVGLTGYTSYAVIPAEWYRLVISVKNGTHYRYYLDGLLAFDGNIQEVDGRFSLEPLLLLMADDDGDDGSIEIAEVGIWSTALTSWQVQSLGGFSHLQPLDPMQPAGRWKFDNVDNLAEGYFGKDLVLTGSELAIEGPSAQNKAVRIGPGSYYAMEPGIGPNGGGSYINEFSMQFDFKVPEIGKWYAFLQTNTSNGNDGDLFVNADGQIGVASTGYSDLKINAGEWYRLIISVRNGEFFHYFLDGKLLFEGLKQDLDGRFGLEDKVLLFADNDGEDGEIDIADVAFWGRALADTEVVKLGGYAHENKKVAGSWKFDDAGDILKAEAGLGLPLELVGSHEAIEGPAPGNGAIRIDKGSHYRLTHGIAPNGGGLLVNEYTIHADIKIPLLSGWHTLFQTTPENNNDGDCFIKSSGVIGVGDTGYSTEVILANEWYRVVISVKNGTHYQYYWDGQLVYEGTVQGIDSRFALAPVLLMFGDDDGDDGSIDCAEITVWNYALNADEVAALGGFGHLVSVEGDEATALVSEYEMKQNYPNPFNPETSISYALLHSGPVRLEVYNTLGRKMATLVDEHQESGRHSVRLSGAGWPSGVYFYKLSVNGFTQTRKMFLCR